MWSSHGRIARALAIALALVVPSLTPSLAIASPPKAKAKHAASAKKGKASKHASKHSKKARSIGPPNHGRLEGAARLKGSRHLKQRGGAHSWALPQMVNLLHHAARAVARKHRHSVMFVGDLSGKTGGHIDRHGSHQSGRDADVAFYVANSRGKPLPIKRFIAFDDAGNARDVPGARFDDARNWAMVEAMLEDKRAHVRYLFVTNALKARLLAYAHKKHAPKAIIERASAAMMSPPDADLHDDHFHVRIACPESMRDVCVEESTVRAEPKAAIEADGDRPGPTARNDAGEGAGQP